MIEKIRELWSTVDEECTVTKLDGLLALLVAALAGCIVGMLVSPRRTKTFGCGNGCHRYYGLPGGESEEEDEEDE